MTTEETIKKWIKSRGKTTGMDPRTYALTVMIKQNKKILELLKYLLHVKQIELTHCNCKTCKIIRKKLTEESGENDSKADQNPHDTPDSSTNKEKK